MQRRLRFLTNGIQMIFNQNPNNIIYALVDPRTEEIRYIGKSTSGLKRVKQHNCPSTFMKPYTKNRNLTKRQAWLKSLYLAGMNPKNIVLVTVLSIEDLSNEEISFISLYRRLGYNLVNGTSGGEGVRGTSAWNKSRIGVSDETRQKMSQAKLGKVSYNARQIVCLDDNLVYRSAIQASTFYQVNDDCIRKVCNGTRKSAGGLKFEYHETTKVNSLDKSEELPMGDK